MIISVFGKEGSGKTTLACSFGEILSDRKMKTLVVSAETRYGILQRRFGTSIEKNKSMYLGFLNGFENKGFYKLIRERLGIVSLADEDDITSYNELGEQIIKSSIEKMKEDFDVIVFDCTARATDELTYQFLQASDKVVNVVESSIDGMVFQNAHEKLFDSEVFKAKTVNVLNKHLESAINLSTVKEITGSNYSVVYDYRPSIVQDLVKSENNRYIGEVSEDILDIVTGIEEQSVQKKGIKGVFGRLFA